MGSTYSTPNLAALAFILAISAFSASVASAVEAGLAVGSNAGAEGFKVDEVDVEAGRVEEADSATAYQGHDNSTVINQ